MGGLGCLVGGVAIAWTAGALYFDLPAPPMLRNVAALTWALVAGALCAFGHRRGRLLVALGFALLVGWWSTLRPRQGRDWQPQVAFSIEMRPERSEAYSALGGLCRQFELIYLAADERDVVRLRTNFRGEDLYLYRLRVPPEEVRARFMEYIHRLNQLHDRPAWYNAVTANCTASIRAQRAASARSPWDRRMLVNGYADQGRFGLLEMSKLQNGYADQMLYERHALAGDLPFAELKARARINERARAAGNAPDFSARIRAGAPGFEGEGANRGAQTTFFCEGILISGSPAGGARGAFCCLGRGIP